MKKDPFSIRCLIHFLFLAAVLGAGSEFFRSVSSPEKRNIHDIAGLAGTLGFMPIAGIGKIKRIALFFPPIFTGGITLAKITGNWQNETLMPAYQSYSKSSRQQFSSFDPVDPKNR